MPHGMFTRNGGQSAAPFDSLNLSYGVGDLPELVRANRKKLKEIVAVSRLVSMRQVHGPRILHITEGVGDQEYDGYDALMTDQPGTGLLIQQADCQAVLLNDPVKKVIAAVHNGWRGSIVNILGRTVAAMRQQYGVAPATLQAVISPSLGPCCAEFVHYRDELPRNFLPFQVRNEYFDFWQISRYQLTEAGLRDENIDTATICTVCDQRFFSYRRAVRAGSPVTGRNGSLIALPQVETTSQVKSQIKGA